MKHLKKIILITLICFIIIPRVYAQGASCDVAVVMKDDGNIQYTFHRAKSGLYVGLFAVSAASIAGSSLHSSGAPLSDPGKFATQSVKNAAISSAFVNTAAHLTNGAREDVINRPKAGKREQTDALMQKETDRALTGWKLNTIIASALKTKLENNGHTVCQPFIQPNNFKFKAIPQGFYQQGEKYFKNETAYDYTSLTKNGIKQVIEVYAPGSITAHSWADASARAVIQSRVRVIDLKNKKVVLSKDFLELTKGKGKHKDNEWTENNGQITKQEFTALANNLADRVLKKIKKII